MAGERDGADMDVDGVTTAITGLGASGTTFHSAWSAATAAGSGGLGQGPMGAAFLAGFGPGAQQLNTEADRIARSIQGAADAAHGAVADYQTGSDAARDAVRQAGSPHGRG